ncbi:Uncharacterised protein [Yersinia enterocolitica]|uniref:DUF4435 domain-containing protein n=2 Tax=Yersinia TaxID=629 RepID=UPI0005E0FB24|nr:DUF4435 domain-containing protein [Yersinia enterocolitica]CQJ17718.1 Uncharacterised protein [Yersinia enterocolitica]CQQ84234.1 Uncharacterised protein [Yersinia enterocolitica]
MNSLQDNLSTEDWVDTTILLFQHPKYYNKAFFIVEGESDVGFFKGMFLGKELHFDSPCCGKPEVIKAVYKLRGYNHDNVYGICDSDFDFISGKIREYENKGLIFTDYHDVEMMLVNSNSFDKFYHEFTRLEVFRHHEMSSDDVKNNIFDAAYKIGLLKWINYDFGLSLNFKGMRYADFIEVESFNISFNFNNLLHSVIGRSKNFTSALSVEEIERKYREYEGRNAEKLHICNGHDFSNILALVYKQELSKDRNMNQDRVESHLRMGYPKEIFYNTDLYNNMKAIFTSYGVDA